MRRTLSLPEDPDAKKIRCFLSYSEATPYVQDPTSPISTTADVQDPTSPISTATATADVQVSYQGGNYREDLWWPEATDKFWHGNDVWSLHGTWWWSSDKGWWDSRW